MPFDPGRDGWPLDEAVMRLSGPEALAELARLCSTLARKERWGLQPRWWVEALAPEVGGHGPAAEDRNKRIGELDSCHRADVPRPARRGGAHRMGAARLADGRLRACPRGRVAGAARQEVPLALARERDMGHGGHARPGTPHSVGARTAPPPDSHGNLTVRTVNRMVPRPLPELMVVLRLYSVRVQPPGRRVGKSASEARCREWLAGLMRAQPDAPRPKAELEEEVRRTFGLGQRAFGRAWRGALAEAGPAWSRAGPRKSRR